MSRHHPFPELGPVSLHTKHIFRIERPKGKNYCERTQQEEGDRLVQEAEGLQATNPWSSRGQRWSSQSAPNLRIQHD